MPSSRWISVAWLPAATSSLYMLIMRNWRTIMLSRYNELLPSSISLCSRFTARPGETIAIVGETGSGKSTLTQLINRIFDADNGRVLVDGVDVRDWNLESLRPQISTIEQDVFLFSRTLAENIAFGCPDATQEEIEQAAREAQAHEFITSFSDGYGTEVGERGVTLSGGPPGLPA